MKISKSSNPVVGIYKGRNLRKYNTIEISLSVTEFKSIIDQKIDNNLSMSDIVKKVGFLCKPTNK